MWIAVAVIAGVVWLLLAVTNSIGQSLVYLESHTD